MDDIPNSSPSGLVEVHLFAAARAAAGAAVLHVQPGTLREVLDRSVEQRPGLAEVLPRCSYLVDQISTRDEQQGVPAESRVDVLPPFAGG